MTLVGQCSETIFPLSFQFVAALSLASSWAVLWVFSSKFSSVVWSAAWAEAEAAHSLGSIAAIDGIAERALYFSKLLELILVLD